MSAHAGMHTRYSRMTMNRMGLWLFILSEAFLFVVFLVTRYYLTGTSQPDDLDQVLPAVLTVVLLSSSVTGYQALRAMRRGDNRAAARYLLITMAIGVAFIAGVGMEWSEGFHAFPPSTLYGSSFFTLTGAHVAHMVTGLMLLLVSYFKVRRGAYTAESHWGLEAGIRYWTFVDAAWLVIYPTLYLV